MRRYFFDVVIQGRTTYDYDGTTFTTAQEAYQFAELIALDVGVKFRDEFYQHAVYVRTEKGDSLFYAYSWRYPLTAGASKRATVRPRAAIESSRGVPGRPAAQRKGARL
jgi:hypothetical protein